MERFAKKLNKDKRKGQRKNYILIWGGSSSVSIFFTSAFAPSALRPCVCRICRWYEGSWHSLDFYWFSTDFYWLSTDFYWISTDFYWLSTDFYWLLLTLYWFLLTLYWLLLTLYRLSTDFYWFQSINLINVTSVIIKKFKNKISTCINRVNMNESNINVTSVIRKHWNKCSNNGAQ